MSKYSSSDTSYLSSKLISEAWPSQILTQASATVANVWLNWVGVFFSGSEFIIISKAFENKVSPAKIATFSSQTLCTAGFPLLISSSSMISSWISENVWISSIAAADFNELSLDPPTASEVIKVKAGLSILPPALVK